MALIKPTRHRRRIWVKCTGCKREAFQWLTDALAREGALCWRCKQKRKKQRG